MKIRPVLFVWSGEAMVPVPRFMPLCDRQYVNGEEYPMEPVQPRSMRSHSHFFAALYEAWMNLNEDDAKRFPTAEALRAKALVETGFYTEKDYACDSPSKAKYLAKIIRSYSEYAVIKVSGDVVKVFDPKSQSVQAMGHDEFQASKTAVLDYVATLARTTRKELEKEATKVAPPEQKPKAAATPAPAKSIGDPYLVPTEAAGWTGHSSTYFTYARSWILAATGKELSWQRWDSERDLRDQLRVSIPNRRELKGLLARQFEEAEAAR